MRTTGTQNVTSDPSWRHYARVDAPGCDLSIVESVTASQCKSLCSGLPGCAVAMHALGPAGAVAFNGSEPLGTCNLKSTAWRLVDMSIKSPGWALNTYVMMSPRIGMPAGGVPAVYAVCMGTLGTCMRGCMGGCTYLCMRREVHG